MAWKATTISGNYRSNVSGVLKGAIFADSDTNGAELLSFGDAGQQLPRDVGQQGVGQDVVHIARAAFDFRTTLSDLVDDVLVVWR